MNRRNFLSLFSAGVAGIALEQAIPLGRVWSFPKEIVIAGPVGTLFTGVDWGFGIDRTVFTRTYWKRTPEGVLWARLETANQDGSWTELHGWQIEARDNIPFVRSGVGYFGIEN